MKRPPPARRRNSAVVGVRPAAGPRKEGRDEDCTAVSRARRSTGRGDSQYVSRKAQTEARGSRARRIVVCGGGEGSV